MEIKGSVTAGVIRDNETGRYKVDVGGREYEVVSKGRQAIKDYLFIRKGQRLEIEGEEENSRIRLEKCKIDIQSECNKNQENAIQEIETQENKGT
ncbi:MAG TPA: hypothetical protein H9761_16255 [Candidatus Eisenbergiella merdavium]|uniref:Uncharacterized protein n=1 Tax=Candidatus Eisenbergiella merdavium TaxID=2838551 RepID=A0A9D2NIW4_9FIRM|nr:hypothetical protein [Candidatus Eisenbergiella merdavium]